MTTPLISFKNSLLVGTGFFLMTGSSLAAEDFAAGLSDALTGGKTYVNVRVRYENVDQDGLDEKAKALTVRTKLGYKTAEFKGFSGLLEVEDSRNLADENYNNTINGNTAYPVVADPSHTEVNQVYLSYSGFPQTKITAGRQSINLGNQRFVGTVGWRQNDQNFDSVSLVNNSIEDMQFYYAYVWNVNRIFGNESAGGDHSSNHHLFHVDYTGFAYGKVTAYAYLLDNNDVPGFSTNTIGIRFAGKTPVGAEAKMLYEAEFAHQTSTKNNSRDYGVNYVHVVGGMGLSGATLKAGFEMLGSENGGMDRFQTPLATLHKFNGWADKFLSTPVAGLEDFYITGSYAFSGQAQGVKAMATYHKFRSQFGDIDYGNELDMQLSYAFATHYSLALKFADYNADSYSVDTQKLWLTLGVKF